MILSLLLALAAQGDRLPPANPLPYADPEMAAVMTPITALLGALERSDGGAVLAVTLPEGAATVAQEEEGGVRRHRTIRWSEFAAGLKPERGRMVERLGEPAVEVDGDIAMVWAPYTARVDGKLSHCGYDHFDLIRVAGTWKVLNVTWSQRTTGCAR